MLKSRVSYFFSKEMCNTDNDVEKYIDINPYTLPKNSYEKDKFEKHVLFRKNKNNQNFIEQNKAKYDYIGKHDKLPFWVGIKTLILGGIHILLYGLPTIIMHNILE